MMRRASSGFEPSERGVRFGGGLLDENRGGDEIGLRAQAADREILDRPHRLHAVVGVGRNLELAERVGFGAELHLKRRLEVGGLEKRKSHVTRALQPLALTSNL